MEPRIVIVDDHPLLRAGLKSMLEQQGFHVVGEAGDGRQGAKLVEKLRPQAVITDISMANRNGIEFTRETHRLFPDVKVLIVSMHNETQLIMESFAAGASGYLLKDSALVEVGNALVPELLFEQRPEPFAHHSMVFNNEDALAGGSLLVQSLHSAGKAQGFSDTPLDLHGQ